MKEEQNITKESKPQKTKLKMTFAILFLAILFIVELYLMMNYPTEYLFLGIAGLGILCLVYIVTDLSFRIRQEKDIIDEKKYEKIYKAQKVSYVLMKQNFLNMGKILDRLRENSEVPTDELIEAQKAVGKITIQKNKENAASVLNSNEKVTQHIISLEDKMKDAVHVIEESMNNQSPKSTDRQQEIIENLEKNQAALKEEMKKLAEQIDLRNNEILDAVKKSVSENAAILEEHIVSDISVQIKDNLIPNNTEETVIPTFEDVVPETVAAKEPEAAEEIVMPEESIAEEPAMVTEPDIPKEPAMAAEPDIPKEPAMMTEPDVPKEPAMMTEPDVPKEPAMAAEPDIPAEIIEQKKTETLEDIADSGKIMTPEDIASLLEETDISAEQQEPVKEEKAAMPDLSDPDHIITPEEIAAMLANM